MYSSESVPMLMVDVEGVRIRPLMGMYKQLLPSCAPEVVSAGLPTVSVMSIALPRVPSFFPMLFESSNLYLSSRLDGPAEQTLFVVLVHAVVSVDPGPHAAVHALQTLFVLVVHAVVSYVSAPHVVHALHTASEAGVHAVVA